MIPRSIVKLEAMGCSKEVVGLVLPTGFFLQHGWHRDLHDLVGPVHRTGDRHPSWSRPAATILFVMLFTSKGAAGVTGGGFVALAATMPALGVLPVGGLALLLGVDRFMAEIRAVTNLFSNIFATVVIAKWMGELDAVRADAALDVGAAEPPGDGAFARDAGR
jgi:Na+/H+-dicarboxylate symporter